MTLHDSHLWRECRPISQIEVAAMKKMKKVLVEYA
jgi:hypothetical protein